MANRKRWIHCLNCDQPILIRRLPTTDPNTYRHANGCPFENITIERPQAPLWLSGDLFICHECPGSYQCHRMKPEVQK